MTARGSKLQLLAEKDPAEILSKISSNIHGFKSILENPEMTIKETTQAVKTLNKMCEVTEGLGRVLQCLNEILTAELFFHKVVKMVDIYSYDPTPDVVLNTLMLVKNFLQKLPSQSMMQLIPVIAMVQKCIHKFERDSNQSELHNHIQTEFQSIEEIKNVVLETMRKEKTMTSSHREEAPPEDFRTLSVIPTPKDVKSRTRPFMRKNVILETMRKEKTMTSSHREEAPPEDFRTLSVIPTPKDVKSRTRPFMRKNVIKGQYKDVDDYLDIQFRLLREDLIAPLRNGVQLLMKKKERREKIQRQDLQDISVYEGVRLLEPVATSKGVMLRVYFRVSDCEGVNWETNKRLIFGSLLCLSSDNFKTMLFCSVADRNPGDIRYGTFFVKMEGDIPFLNPDPDEVYTMVETSSYFEAYRYNLEGLQKKQEATLPMKKYLLGTETKEVNYPGYLKQDSQYTIQKKKVKVLDLKTWPTVEDTIFEEAQYKALQNALTKEFAVIQGPPGTGKTFLGLEIMKVLLHEDNKKCWKQQSKLSNKHRTKQPGRQILIVCYTNHALDQFVEGILKFQEDRIIRIGGGSKSENEKLKKCLIQNYKRKYRYEYGNDLKDEKKKIQATFNSRMEKLILTKKSILNEKALQQTVYPHHYESLISRTRREGCCAMEQWLIFDEQESFTCQNQMPVNQKEKKAIDDEESDLDAEMFADDMSNDRLIYGMDDSSEASEIYSKVYEKAFELEDDIETRELIIFHKGELQNRQSKWMKRHEITKEQYEMLKKRFNETKKMNQWEVLQIQNVWKLNMDDRWCLYRYWIHNYCSQEIGLTDIEKEYRMKVSELNDLHLEKDLEAMQTADIIAMTTTGAAKYFKVLQKLKPVIVIVEEAAEVLEAHIVTSLSEGCEHLILIGDHKQLKPKSTVYQLGRQYHLDVSLFERMIKNGMHCDTLNIQHRMRKEICALLVPYIYTDLTNHKSVYKYPNMMGITRNMFFFNHKHLEDEIKGTSHSNIFEARFIVKLGHYFMLQGYSAEQITILTTYLGQMFTIRRIVRSNYNVEHPIHKLKITAVDNYQGEENDIILLSLVRSNEENKVGFLKISNRVCVALSRAKMGFYVIGNMAQLEAASPLWEEIISDLKATGSVVDALPLACHNHPENRIDARNPEDFAKAPEGGCMKSCDYRLSCGHVCERKCHPTDPKHTWRKCQKPCQRKCEKGHVCPKLCYEDCGDCLTIVPDREWPCGHVLTTYCHRRPENFGCDVIVDKRLQCQHALLKQMKCSQDVRTYPCNEPTNLELVCGHVVIMRCYLAKRYRKRGKLGEVEFTEYDCKIELQVTDDEKSRNLLAVRTHEIQMRYMYHEIAYSKILERYKCTESIDVTLKCGHVITTKCAPLRDQTLERFLETFQCEKLVDKELPCKHQIVKMKCCDDATVYKCHEICDQELKCGHSIKIHCCLSRKMVCHKKTDIVVHFTQEEIKSLLCQEMITATFKCGHTSQEKCHTINKSEILHSHENAKCKVNVDLELYCGHKIRAYCNLARQYNRHIRNGICIGDCDIDEDLDDEEKEQSSKTSLTKHLQSLHCCFTTEQIHCLQCEEIIFMNLECGHEVQEKCNTVNSLSQKKFPWCTKCTVTVDLELDCGHCIKTSCDLSKQYNVQKKTIDLLIKDNFERITPATRYNLLHRKSYLTKYAGLGLFCEEFIVVTLKCGHIMQEKCNIVNGNQNFQDSVKCTVLVDLELDCGHSIKAKCHTAQCYKEADHDAFMKTLDCEKRYFPCEELVKVNLICGHQITEKCHITQTRDYKQDAKCSEFIHLKLACGHWIETTCWLGSCYNYIQQNGRVEVKSRYKIIGLDLESLTCKKDFLVVQPCGHSLEVSCIELYSYFQSNSEYSAFADLLWDIPTILKKKLNKRCPRRVCLFEDKSHLHLVESEVKGLQRNLSHECREKNDFTLPCSHIKTLECHQIEGSVMINDFSRMHGKGVADQKSQLPEENLDEEECINLKLRSLTKDSVTFCQKLVDIPLYCQHRIISVSCGVAQMYQLITNAVQQEKEHLPLLEAQFKAHLGNEAFKCPEIETHTLDCGHQRTLTCSELLVHKVLRQFSVLKADKCDKLVTLHCPSGAKSHIWQVNCHQNSTAGKCPFVCGDVLICGHKCRQKCGECFYSGEHPPCREPCQRQLLCGHLCDRSCLDLCPLVCQFCHTVPRLQYLTQDIQKVETIQERFMGHPMNIIEPCQKLGQFPNLKIEFEKPLNVFQTVVISLVYIQGVCQQLYKNGKQNLKTNLEITDKILSEEMKLATESLQRLDKKNWRKHLRHCIHMWVQLYFVLQNIVKLKGILVCSGNMIQSCKRNRTAKYQKEIGKEIQQVLQYGEEGASHILDQLEFYQEVPKAVKILRCLSKPLKRRNLSIGVGLGGTTWFKCNQGHLFPDLKNKDGSLFLCGVCEPKPHVVKTEIRMNSKCDAEDLKKRNLHDTSFLQSGSLIAYRKDDMLQSQLGTATSKKKQRRKNKKTMDSTQHNSTGDETEISVSQHTQLSEEPPSDSKCNPWTLGARPKTYDMIGYHQLTHEKNKGFPKFDNQNTVSECKVKQKEMKHFEEELPKEESQDRHIEDNFEKGQRWEERPGEERAQDTGDEITRRTEQGLGAWEHGDGSGGRGRGNEGYEESGSQGREFREGRGRGNERHEGWGSQRKELWGRGNEGYEGLGSQGRELREGKGRGNEGYDGWRSQSREFSGGRGRGNEGYEGWGSQGKGLRGGKRRGKRGRH